ncbi:MAG: phosphoribosylformylglycinamidine cyclo-ligase [Cyanobacteriota bacterium]|nr:phosphoribosylformylglycinamidine cyclo-ligase [Cyanobacteriota bacterium]
MDYRSAGVDVLAGRAFIDRIRHSVDSTRRPEVLGGVGGFAGLCRLPEGLRRPLLVAGTDGVGTKLELAQRLDRHRGVGIDLVAMCVNDVITSGAEPLLFLDYIATGCLAPDHLAEVVEGIAEGCRLSGCTLLGGETAEMPGFYQPGTYDLAGFCLGVVEEDRRIDGQRVRVGDRVVGVASSGVHSNGFSLVRRILEERQVTLDTRLTAGGPPLLVELLTPTLLYGPLVKQLLAANLAPHGMAHITGGGLPENLPRCLPKGCHARIDPDAWERPAVFRWLQENGQVPEADLWNTFNLGVGFCLVVGADAVTPVVELCHGSGYAAWEMGRVDAGDAPGLGIAGLPFKPNPSA